MDEDRAGEPEEGQYRDIWRQWEHMGESPHYYQMFLTFFSMTNRGVRQFMRQEEAAGRSYGDIPKISTRYKWLERAKAWDSHNLAQSRKLMEAKATGAIRSFTDIAQEQRLRDANNGILIQDTVRIAIELINRDLQIQLDNNDRGIKPLYAEEDGDMTRTVRYKKITTYARDLADLSKANNDASDRVRIAAGMEYNGKAPQPVTVDHVVASIRSEDTREELTKIMQHRLAEKQAGKKHPSTEAPHAPKRPS